MHFKLKSIIQKDLNHPKHYEVYICYSISTSALTLALKENVGVSCL